MFLRRLEVQGFKSFADKVVFDFTNGITVIVGPNGSGKSNVTDSIRWLLGERDARSLRGAKVEDLIFAGTEKRARVGQAQASLYFDNSSGFFPVDFDEVSISRKISRDGTSEFFLNKAEVRLKDIIDFFAKSRLGARGFNVVGQGDSDVFIKATSIERREMIEETLGLKEYQIKKFDAKRRLKNSLLNLDKANALIEELKPHLRFLKKQVSRYEGREELVSKLKEMEDGFYGSRFKELEADLKKFEPQQDIIEKEIKSEEKNLGELELELEKVRKSEPESNQELKNIQASRAKLLGERSNFQKELGRNEARIELSANEADFKTADLVSVLKEIKALTVSLEEENNLEVLRGGIKKIAELSGKLFDKSSSEVKGALEKDGEKLLKSVEVIDNELKKIAETEKGFTSNLEGFNKKFEAVFLRLEKKRNDLSKLSEEKNRLNLELERISLRSKDLEYQLVEIGRKKSDFENWQGVFDGNEELIRREMFKVRGELSNIGDVDETLVKEAKETEERYTFLTNQVSDLGKAISDLKTLIKELDYKIDHEFTSAIKTINEEFNKFIGLMFGGGRGKLVIVKDGPPKLIDKSIEDEVGKVEKEIETEEEESQLGIEIELSLPKKKVKGLEILSGGERSLVSTAALFALISVSPPPFLVLDEIDAALDERNARRFSELLMDFAKKTQFIIISHNRTTMEVANALYGITMSGDGTSQVLSLKLES